MNDIKSLVKQYQEEGLSFIPIPFKSKVPIIVWKDYQTRKPTQEEVNSWFNGHDTNIAVICGKVSDNLVVLDADSVDTFYELASTICEKTGCGDIFDYTKITQTARGFHIWLKVAEPVKNQKFPKLDIKSDGGYIIAPPSTHPDGPEYKLANPGVGIKHIQSLKDIGVDTNQGRDISVTDNVTPHGNQPGWVTSVLQGVVKGDRDATAFKLAGYFKNLMPIDITTAILTDWNKKNDPPLPNADILKTINSAYKYSNSINGVGGGVRTNSPQTFATESERDKSVTQNVTPVVPLSERIEEWCQETKAWFSYDELDRELEIKLPDGKTNRRKIISRLRESGKLESHPKDNKLLRWINTNIRLIDFKSATQKNPLAIKLPFGEEKYCNIFPGNIIVVAGAPNAGKTGWLLNVVRNNQFDFPIYYQSSEMGQDEMAIRLEKFDGIKLNEWNFTAEERSSQFADVIRPDCVNIIDYMEISDSFYIIAEYLRQIYDKLNTGIAIVALQKNPGSDTGRGGAFGLEKPRLYLSIDDGKIKIVKAKNWAKLDINPNGLVLDFKLAAGCKFIVENDWHIEAE